MPKNVPYVSRHRHRFVSAHLFLNQQPVMWTNKFRYLGVQFLCGNTIEVDVVSVKRQFYAACNSILPRSSGTCDPVKVQLVKSYCLPLLVYCIIALRLKRSTVQHLGLSVCWNDAFRKNFHYKRFESVKMLQIQFGTMDFSHLYDFCRWNFWSSVLKKKLFLVSFFDHAGLEASQLC